MTIRKRIFLTVGWILFSFVLGMSFAIWLAGSSRSSGNRKALSAQAGTLSAVLAGTGCAGLWLPWAAAQGKRRREEREQKTKPAAAKRPSKPSQNNGW